MASGSVWLQYNLSCIWKKKSENDLLYLQSAYSHYVSSKVMGVSWREECTDAFSFSASG